MKSFTFILLGFLGALGISGGNIWAQSCLNCWINPQTGQEESLDRIFPRQAPSNPSPSPGMASPPPSDEAQKPDESGKSPPEPSEVPIFDDPVGREETEPRPFPQTQVDPRLRFRQQEQKLEGEN